MINFYFTTNIVSGILKLIYSALVKLYDDYYRNINHIDLCSFQDFKMLLVTTHLHIDRTINC
jgi:hypothetical protein